MMIHCDKCNAGIDRDDARRVYGLCSLLVCGVCRAQFRNPVRYAELPSFTLDGAIWSDLSERQRTRLLKLGNVPGTWEGEHEITEDTPLWRMSEFAPVM